MGTHYDHAGGGQSYNICLHNASAEIAQLGERQTEDLKVPGSIPGFGISFAFFIV